ncbi:hypothetical protein RvY_16754 [Ramazzottius varieornatus]|uniref:Uncharacterized protein n=1 Tax=Ramazzottius varieornatus TaxID=947166 RepID=A0A1D1W270_RAMVA|nr:hypothetical protein RvY_16754 [Ramazzottius varieornatus]
MASLSLDSNTEPVARRTRIHRRTADDQPDILVPTVPSRRKRKTRAKAKAPARQRFRKSNTGSTAPRVARALMAPMLASSSTLQPSSED